MNLSNGRIWPYGIGAAIILVFSFCVTTIVVTSKSNLQLSDDYMTKYQDADARVNEFIKAKLAFNKKYTVKYITKSIPSDTISYSVVDKNNKPVNDAKLILNIGRSETAEYNKKLTNPKVKDGIYTFENVKFEKPGIWHFMLKVSVGKNYRFYNIKADTRKKKIIEY